MVLIALSWIYILFTTINLGVFTNKALNLKNTNFAVNSILGLFATTIIASIWAIFGRINMEFHVFYLVLNGVILFKYKSEVATVYRDFGNLFKSLGIGFRLFLIATAIFILAQCASRPYVIDNESYYIQTIKWLNEYGFVKGLVNLHFFLGQLSGWHITQSVFNFSFLYTNFNDLSGFCLLLGNLFAIEKLNDYFRNKNKIYLLAGLLPMANFFFFQFISAPSPDIPVYVVTFILLFYFLKNYNTITPEAFNLISILVLFSLYIKNTTLVFVLIPMLLFLMHYKVLIKSAWKPLSLAFLVLALFITKNMIICGSPVFPSRSFDFTMLDWAIPKQIEQFYFNELKLYGYFVTHEQYESMTAWDLFRQWMSLPKLNGLFNKLSILLILVCPIFIYRFYHKKAMWALYVLMIVQMLLLFATSPQFRFFMNFLLFFSMFCFGCVFKSKRFITTIMYLTVVPTLIILFIPIDLNKFSNYRFMIKISNFSVDNTVYPYKNTKYDTAFEPIVNGNLHYNSPVNNSFFWGSGDGNLPCVNKDQIAYFEKYFYIRPQLRTNDLKDGFYAQKTTSNEP